MARPSLRRLAPGLAVLALLAVASRLLATVVPGLSPLIVAVVLGALVANAVGTPEWAAPGVATGSLFLEIGIVLLGASVSLAEVRASGPVVVLLVVLTVAAGVVGVELLARRVFGLRDQMASLLAAGSSICGVSAAAAVAGTIDADGDQLTHVVATVLLFDAVTLLVFPIAGDLLALSGKQFGVWAGLSMFSTGPVAAAGFAHSPVAGRWATVTKLTRNSLLGVVAVGYAARYAADGGTSNARLRQVWTEFPKFLVGFLVVAAVANAGLLSSAALASIDTVADWLFTLAFVGLGFDIQVSEMRDTGVTPVLVVLVQLLAVSTLTLVAVTTLF
jgi:uncharacterized integral membrane protein (TIGR00698 family)